MKTHRQQKFDRCLNDYREILDDESLAELRSICDVYDVDPNQPKYRLVPQLARNMTEQDFRLRALHSPNM